MAADRPRPGHGQKLRVMVDKVMCEVLDDAGMVRETAEAGFNVICPRFGGGDLGHVRKVANLAAKHGIYHLVWMRGTLEARGQPQRVRYVLPNGHVSNLYSPNSEEFWQWTNKLIVGYARISATQPALMGVFLDYEVYDRPKFGNAYNLSYDEQILEQFAAAEGVKLPALAPKERKGWLAKQGLHKRFEVFQVAQWRRRCRNLRKAVDKHNPKFQFCVYPIPRAKFCADAALAEWGTPQAPLIIAHHGTYGQRIQFEDFRHALDTRRERLRKMMAWARGLRIPLSFMSGLDPIGIRGDPEHFGRSAAMISEATDGYWVFYEGPDYQTDHKDYFRWFARGNKAVEEGNWAFWREARETPTDYSHKPLNPGKPQLAETGVGGNIFKLLGQEAGFEIHQMRERYELDARFLGNFDVVMFRQFNGGPNDPKQIGRELRKYVAAGGGLLLTHDQGWLGPSPFPAIAQHVAAGGGRTKAMAMHKGRLTIKAGHEALCQARQGATYEPLYPPYVAWQPGPKGTVLVVDEAGRAVCVAGTFGKGRVVFCGTFLPQRPDLWHYYRKRKDLHKLSHPSVRKWLKDCTLEGAEREVLVGVIRWLRGEALRTETKAK